MSKKFKFPLKKLPITSNLKLRCIFFKKSCAEVFQDWVNLFSRPLVLTPLLALFGVAMGLEFIDKSPSITPDNFLYSIKTYQENHHLAALKTAENRANYLIELADKKLAEAKYLENIDQKSWFSLISIIYAENFEINKITKQLIKQSFNFLKQAKIEVQSINNLKIANSLNKKIAQQNTDLNKFIKNLQKNYQNLETKNLNNLIKNNIKKDLKINKLCKFTPSCFKYAKQSIKNMVQSKNL